MTDHVRHLIAYALSNTTSVTDALALLVTAIGSLADNTARPADTLATAIKLLGEQIDDAPFSNEPSRIITDDEILVYQYPLNRGGQHVQADRGALAVHRDTGLAMVVSSERSWHGNSTAAIAKLRTALGEVVTVWRDR